MTFLLPEEGTSPEALLENSTAMDLILHGLYSLEGTQYGDVIYTIPKFDVSSNVDLMEPLAQLGLTQIQDASAADFSPLRQEPSFLTNASTAARVRIDEAGAEGASYVMIATGDSSDAPDEDPPVCVLELDRPFLFLISGSDSLPRFVGVVNQP